MEPESNPLSPTSQSLQPETPMPAASAPSPVVEAPTAPLPTQAEAPVEASAPATTPEVPVQTPTEAPAPAPAPVVPPTPPVTPPEAPTQGAMPPVPPSAPAAPIAPASGSHGGLLIGLLLAALLIGGAGAAYYYWMNIKASSGTTTAQTADVATSTENLAADAPLSAADAELRLTLEGSVSAMNAALASGSYEDLMKVMSAPESGRLPTKQEFTQSLNMLKDYLTVDLSKTTFLKVVEQGNVAGYYYLTEEPSTATGTAKVTPVTVLGMIKFVNDNGTWKILKLYSAQINDPSKVSEELSANQEFSLSATATTTGK